MSEVSNTDGEGAKRGGAALAVAAAVVLGAVVGGGVLYARLHGANQTAPAAEGKSGLARYAVGALKKLKTPAQAAAQPTTPFNDAAGRPVDLSKFRGKVVVLNLWATWCAPCVTEMPTLAALQRRYAGTDLLVLPVSLDRPDDLADAKSFIGVHEPLPLYHDPKFALPSALKVQGLPTTVVYDREGREVARLAGEAKWDSPEAVALFDHLLKK
jgi:thiol-disulfide isomerase/thioredoxin